MRPRVQCDGRRRIARPRCGVLIPGHRCYQSASSSISFTAAAAAWILKTAGGSSPAARAFSIATDHQARSSSAAAVCLLSDRGGLGLDDADEGAHLSHRLIEDGIGVLDDVAEAPENLEVHRTEELCPCR